MQKFLNKRAVFSLVIALLILFGFGEWAERLKKAEPYLEDILVEEKNSNQEAETYTSLKIVDGDTFYINYKGTEEKVRIVGIDTPELQASHNKPECLANEATDRLGQLLENKEFTISLDSIQGERDKYDRPLVYVDLLDGTDVGAQLIKEGYAKELTIGKGYDRKEQYKELEKTAQQNSIGIWNLDVCVPEPV